MVSPAIRSWGSLGFPKAGPEAGIPVADFRGCLGITKKEFFITSKMTVFWQILKSAHKASFRAMNTGLL
jgi:hypothetical protein